MKTYKVQFISSDNVKKESEVVAKNKKEAIRIVKNDHKGYKNFK
jgi:hypothetical protein